MVTRFGCNRQLHRYLEQIDNRYLASTQKIDLFNPEFSLQWTKQRKEAFAGVFYHLRGHFVNFMWYVANFTSNSAIKQMILDNYAEELGLEHNKSHEALYGDFAAACHINIHDEIVEQTHNVKFVRDFNQNHLRWLSQHSHAAQFAAFSAYERLDNIDYPLLHRLASQFNLTEKELLFFRVHFDVEHFDSTFPVLEKLWCSEQQDVCTAFEFIYSTQIAMWQQLNDFLMAIN